VERQQVEFELSQPAISPDCPERVDRLVTCHADPYSAAAEGSPGLNSKRLFVGRRFVSQLHTDLISLDIHASNHLSKFSAIFIFSLSLLLEVIICTR
jgi:hypothetical protein